MAVNVKVTNQGSATAQTGGAAATAQTGNSTVQVTASTSTTASPAPSGSAAPKASASAVPASPVASAPAVSGILAASNGATANSGNATAIGVVADTRVIGNQAVVVHIPSQSSNHVIDVSLTADVSNKGVAISQSGTVVATGLDGSLAAQTGQTPAAAAVSPTLNSGSTSVDLRDTNYALANSGDALAIGVKATTAVQGFQRITVIIDDNSSGNRVVITFHVRVHNDGQASATTGAASAVGQRGDVMLASTGSKSASAALDNAASARSGDARALGVEANTAITTLQRAMLIVGNDSSHNLLDVLIDVDVLNEGKAMAVSGEATATGLAGDAAQGEPSGPALQLASSGNGSLTVSNTASGRSGDASSKGVGAKTSIREKQNVQVHVDPLADSSRPVVIQASDYVVNLGMGLARTGDAVVTAQVIPPSVPAAPPSAAPSPSPSPAAAATTDQPDIRGQHPGLALRGPQFSGWQQAGPAPSPSAAATAAPDDAGMVAQAQSDVGANFAEPRAKLQPSPSGSPQLPIEAPSHAARDSHLPTPGAVLSLVQSSVRKILPGSSSTGEPGARQAGTRSLPTGPPWQRTMMILILLSLPAVAVVAAHRRW